MKALTLHQPWASLVALGVKTIETRSWSTTYRGPLVIHAGAKQWGIHPPGWQWEAISDVLDSLDWYDPDADEPLPLGAIVATCTLVDVVPIVWRTWPQERPEIGWRHFITVHPSDADCDRLLLWDEGNHAEAVLDDQRPYGDFTPGRYAWLLDDVKPTTERCPACWGEGYMPPWPDGEPCPLCNGAQRCDPIPARGRQGLWEWTP